jgi:glycosyltransferase involved in cell wall biosynthesis
MTAPFVSVVIPTHNRSRLLRMTLRTALWQRGVDLEVLVVDDGSTDDTSTNLRSIGDPRVRVLRHDTPRGVSTARNRGIEEARGEWVAFLDDDDLWAPDKLAYQITAAEDRAAWAYAGAVKIDAEQKITGGTAPPAPSDVVRALPQRSLIPGGCSGVIVTREMLSQAGGFDPRLVNLADWDLWIRLARTGRPACAYEPLIGYRLHAGQSSLDVDLIVTEAAVLESKYGIALDRGALHHYLAYRSLRAGKRRDARKHFALAIVHGETRPIATDVIRSLARGRSFRRPSVDPDADAAWRRGATRWLAEVSKEYLPPAPDLTRPSSSSSALRSEDA